jgi:hypothetical protein
VAELLKAFVSRLRPVAARSVDIDQAVSGLQRDFGPILRRRHPRRWNESRFDKLVRAVHNDVRDKLISIRHDQAKHHAARFFEPKNKIWVYLNGKTRYLDELSEIVSGMPDTIWRGRIYADEKHRNRVKSFCEKWLNANPLTEGVADVRKEPSPKCVGSGRSGCAETAR